MWVREITDLGMQYVDESDATFLSTAANAVRTQLFKVAYDKFRQIAADADPYAYGHSATLNLSGTSAVYDLAAAGSAVRLLGNPAGGLTGPRLQRIQFVGYTNTDGTFQYKFNACSSMEELMASRAQFNMVRELAYFFADDTILFSVALAAASNITLLYLPQSAVVWANAGAAQNEFVDDYDEFHDLIALLFAEQYSVLEGRMNPMVARLLEIRLQDFQRRLRQGRDLNNSRVAITYTPFG